MPITTSRKPTARKSSAKPTARLAKATDASTTKPPAVSPQAAATVGHDHEAHWPDKLVFAALLLMVAGTFGLLHGVLVSTGAVLGPKLPAFLREYPLWAVFAGSAVALAAGWGAFRFQWSLAAWVGVAAACASMGFFGLVPALALVSAVMLVLSRVEGEKTRFKDRVFAEEWPDKAIMASLFFVVAGIFTLAQGGLQYANAFDAFVLPSMPWVWATFSVLAGLALLAGGIACFRLRGGVLGFAGAALGILAAAFYVMGPILALLGVVFMGLAYREKEFTA